MTTLNGSSWHAILEGLMDAAFTLDRHTMVIDSNAAARSLLALEPGRPIVSFNRWPSLLAAIDAALSTGDAQNTQMSLIVPTEHTLRVRVSPIDSEAPVGSPSLLIVLRDTAEEQQLAQMRADFVANASHELRTPLASLSGFVETLRGAAKDDPDARDKFLGIMQEQAFRMTRLIEDLLSLSRIEMREHVAPRDPLDLRTIVEAAITLLKPLATAAKIEISIQTNAMATTVLGDREELSQVAHNLIQNAIKYGRPNGHVIVRLQSDASNVTLAVADDGIGIASQHLPRLTERFYRVSAKDSRDRGGTGLGLAIVKHIVNRHRGELSIESTRGIGSTFTVTLPRAR